MTPLRVVLTCNYSPWSPYSGGGQRSTHALGQALATLGHEVHVCYTKSRFETIPTPTNLRYKPHWADFIATKSDGKNPLRSLNAAFVAQRVRGIVAGERKPTVLHAQGEEGALLHHLTDATTAFVMTPRYPAFEDPLANIGGPRFWLRPKFIALGHGLRHAARICPTSEASAQEVTALFDLDRSRVEVVPNGIADAFLNVQRSTVEADAPWVFFGRLSRTKGVHELVDAWLTLDSPSPLWLGGVGPEEAALRDKISKAGRADAVKWLGWCSSDRSAQVLSTAKAAILPSHEESFGNTMAEALAVGTPLVTTDAGSIPEVVGEHASLVRQKDTHAIVDAMRWIEANPGEAKERADRGRNFARKRYSWTATATQYMRVYQAALGAQRDSK